MCCFNKFITYATEIDGTMMYSLYMHVPVFTATLVEFIAI